MYISNQISIERVSEIYDCILSEPGLTKRTKKAIAKWILLGNMSVLYDKENLCGFIVCERLYKNYYEIMSLFIKTAYRNNGLASSLFKSQIEDTTKSYLYSSYNEHVIAMGIKSGFSVSTSSNLPSVVFLVYLLTRNIKAIFKHLFIKKSTFLLKRSL